MYTEVTVRIDLHNNTHYDQVPHSHRKQKTCRSSYSYSMKSPLELILEQKWKNPNNVTVNEYPEHL